MKRLLIAIALLFGTFFATQANAQSVIYSRPGYSIMLGRGPVILPYPGNYRYNYNYRYRTNRPYNNFNNFGPRNFGPRGFGPRNFGPRNFGPRGFGPRGFGPGFYIRF